MTTHEEVDVDAAGERVQNILHPNGAAKPETTVQQDIDEVQARYKATAPRKKRADAGKPRETFYITVPGVRFDMNVTTAQDAFKSWIIGAIGSGLHTQVLNAIDDLIGEIDRLRAK